MRAHVPEFQRHNLDWDLPAAWAAVAFAGRRANCASTDALTGLPVLAVVRHLTPLPRFAWQLADIATAVKSQDLAGQAQHEQRPFSAALRPGAGRQCFLGQRDPFFRRLSTGAKRIRFNSSRTTNMRAAAATSGERGSVIPL